MNEQQLSTGLVKATQVGVMVSGGVSAGLSIATIVALVKLGHGKTLGYGCLIGGVVGLGLGLALPTTPFILGEGAPDLRY